jgi:arylsulfatase A-like enzyme
VPIIFWRPGERGEEHFWPLRTIDIAPTLANLIGVPTPDTVDGQCQNLGLFDVPACPVSRSQGRRPRPPTDAADFLIVTGRHIVFPGGV